MDIKYKVIFVSMVLILLLQMYMVMVFEPDYKIRKPYEHIIEALRKDNTLLLESICRHEDEVNKFRAQVDSLENLKQEKVKIYVAKYKEIDAASTDVIVNQFQSIFAENGIN